MPTKEKSQDKTETEHKGKAGEPEPDQSTVGAPLSGIEIRGTPKEGKGETRLFQIADNIKEWLDKEEAERRGFYWKDEPKVKTTKG